MSRTAAKNAAPLPAKLAGLLREAKWLALVGLALYLVLVFATFHRTDPGWSHSASDAVTRNAGGVVGAYLADLLLYLFGVSAYWWVALCAYIVVWGYRRLDGSGLIDRRPLGLALGGFALLLLASAAIERLRLHTLVAELPFAPGGVVGKVLGDGLLDGLGFTGATLVVLMVAAVGLSLFTGVSWLALAEAVGLALESTYAALRDAWDRRRDRRLGELA
ncbi:MAG TPA: DNA translocase FtsK 4TM domain-containing protein, partial [Burkholderiales bacterium]